MSNSNNNNNRFHTSSMMDILPWVPNRIPSDLLESGIRLPRSDRERGARQRPLPAWNEVSDDTRRIRMKDRVRTFLSLRDGVLYDTNFVDEKNIFEQRQWTYWTAAVRRISPSTLRQVSLHYTPLTEDHARMLGESFRAAPLLHKVELMGELGFAGESDRTLRNIALIIRGLVGHAELGEFTLRRVSYNATSGDGVVELAEQFARLLCATPSLKKLCLKDCSNDVPTWLFQKIEQSTNVEELVVDSLCLRPMCHLVHKSPKLRSFEHDKYEHGLLPIFQSFPDRFERIRLACEDHMSIQVLDLLQTLRNAQHLKRLELDIPLPLYWRGEVQAPIDGVARAISGLTALEHLRISGNVNMDVGFQCPTLKTLDCPYPVHLGDVFTNNPELSSLSLTTIERSAYLEVLRYMEHNDTITTLKLCHIRKPLNGPSDEPGTAAQLRQTLVSNKSLKHLSLDVADSASMLPVLVSLLETDSLSLESLRLVASRSDVSDLVRSLPKSMTLTSFSLDYQRGDYSTHLWTCLMEVIPRLVTLKSLHIGIPKSASRIRSPELPPPPSWNVDEVAVALSRNSSLTDIQIVQYGTDLHRPKWDFVCRLYSRRNRIRELVRQNKLTPQLLPSVLEGLVPNPSALFLVANLIPWTTSIDESEGASNP